MGLMGAEKFDWWREFLGFRPNEERKLDLESYMEPEAAGETYGVL